MIKAATLLLLAALVLAPAAASAATPIPPGFESHGEDCRAIETLLSTYTKAVSTKDQALFETLLLNKQVPFSGAGEAIHGAGAAASTQNYEGFRKGVFEGPAFTQSFRDIHIDQDGPLAQVSLVFVNATSSGSSWGWKTLQLLKVGGHWKIASEFYTGHA